MKFSGKTLIFTSNISFGNSKPIVNLKLHSIVSHNVLHKWTIWAILRGPHSCRKYYYIFGAFSGMLIDVRRSDRYSEGAEIRTLLEQNAIDIQLRCLLKKHCFLLTQKIYVFILFPHLFLSLSPSLLFYIALALSYNTRAAAFHLSLADWLAACLLTYVCIFRQQWWLETYTCTHKHTHTRTHTHGNNIRIRY